MVENPPNYWFVIQIDSINATIHFLEEAYENRSVFTVDYILCRDYVKLHYAPGFWRLLTKLV